MRTAANCEHLLCELLERRLRFGNVAIASAATAARAAAAADDNIFAITLTTSCVYIQS